MEKKLYGLEIDPKKIETFEEILTANPNLEEIFGVEWINKEIRAHFKNRLYIHPIFFQLLHDSDFPAKLLLLKEEYPRFRAFITQLKNDRDNFFQCVANVDVFFEYRQKHKEVSFQPLNPECGKECDIKVVLDGMEFWGEILTINPDTEDLKLNRLEYEIKIAYNDKNQSMNCVALSFEEMPPFDIKDELTNFLLSESASLNLKEGELVKKKFQRQNKAICEAAFFVKGKKFDRGYYSGSQGPFRKLSDDSRIKNKLLDKLDHFQFPKEGNVKRFFILKLRGFAESEDVDNAIMGQNAVVFSTTTDEAKQIRNQNGILHDPVRAEQLDKISFMVLYERDKKKYRLNGSETLAPEYIETNF